nr:zinc finger protein 385A-like [Leptinotarsa decemlineata]
MSGEIASRVEDVFNFSGKSDNPENTEKSKIEDTNQSKVLSCEICKIKVTSSRILQRHLEGRKHKLRAERQGKIFKCDLCDITANSEIQLDIHLKSE